MIKLEEYGFTQISETDRHAEYEGHGYIVSIYNYPVITFDQCEIAHNTFLVSSKQFTSASRPIHQLGDWLLEKKIQKT